jgi:hypothetical protein
MEAWAAVPVRAAAKARAVQLIGYFKYMAGLQVFLFWSQWCRFPAGEKTR